MSRPFRTVPAYGFALLLLAGTATMARAVDPAPNRPGEPADPKARKTFAKAVDWQNHHLYAEAVNDFRKANQQDGGKCTECLQRAYRLAMQIGDFKGAENIARAMLPQAGNDAERAAAHYRTALAAQNLGYATRKRQWFTESRAEFETSLKEMPQLAPAHYGLGMAYARLRQDDAARREFSFYLRQDKSTAILHARAQRFLEDMDLARAQMAPPFSLTTLDGQHISMDALQGKVVLIDFWATWCGPCRAALPHIRSIARKFARQPLVILSVSLDSDEAKWKDFVAKNGMTWLQYRDGSSGAIANQFGVHAIPATFSIDADGVLQDQHVGDVEIDGKLKKMVARATEFANRQTTEPAAEKSGAGIE